MPSDAHPQWGPFNWYVLADLTASVSARAFQLFCTWFYLSAHHEPERLSILFIVVWIASTSVLPLAGGLAEGTNKGRILLLGSLLALIGALIGCESAENKSEELQFALFVFSATLSSLATGFLAPLATPLVPELFGEKLIEKALSVKSSAYVVNMLLGPALGGMIIAEFSGQACLYFCVAAAGTSLVSSVIFISQFQNPTNSSSKGIQFQRLMTEIVDGAKRVFLIRAERTIASVSLAANFVVLPFMFFLLPAKVLSLGFSMLQLAGLEIAFGMGVLAASTLLLPQLGRFLPKHAVPSTSLSLMAICLLSCALFSSFVALSILLAGMGIGLTCFNVTINAKRAMAIPVGYRATMESALLLACTAAAPFGFWVARVCVEKFGADAIITASGTLFLVAALSLARSLSLRRLLEASNDEVPHYLATNANLFLKGGS